MVVSGEWREEPMEKQSCRSSRRSTSRGGAWRALSGGRAGGDRAETGRGKRPMDPM